MAFPPKPAWPIYQASAARRPGRQADSFALNSVGELSLYLLLPGSDLTSAPLAASATLNKMRWSQGSIAAGLLELTQNNDGRDARFNPHAPTR
jgi:hypothetical protein